MQITIEVSEEEMEDVLYNLAEGRAYPLKDNCDLKVLGHRLAYRAFVAIEKIVHGDNPLLRK